MITKHKRAVPPDSDNRAACRCTMTSAGDGAHLRVTRTYCPRHDPQGYVAYMARHCPDSILVTDPGMRWS